MANLALVLWTFLEYVLSACAVVMEFAWLGNIGYCAMHHSVQPHQSLRATASPGVR
jgi:hypothetical protein